MEISTHDDYAVTTLTPGRQVEKANNKSRCTIYVGKLCGISKRADRKKNRVNIYSGNITNKGDILVSLVNKKLTGRAYMVIHIRLVLHCKYCILAATSAKVGKCINFNNFWWYGRCSKSVHKLRLHLCTKILARLSRTITDGTFYFKAKKYESTAYEIKLCNNKTQLVLANVDKANKGRRTMMVTPVLTSFTNKPLGGKDDIITKTRKIRTITVVIGSHNPGEVQCYNMSRQEIARAVEQIQQAPPTNELAALQAFIEAQNAAGKLIMTNVLFTHTEPRDLYLQIGHNTDETMPDTTNTTIENPGYTTQSENVLHEPVQYQYIYDIMKRVEKPSGRTTDVGEGKQGKAQSTGKANRTKQHKQHNTSRTKPVYSYAVSGTESRVEGSIHTSTCHIYYQQCPRDNTML